MKSLKYAATANLFARGRIKRELATILHLNACQSTIQEIKGLLVSTFLITVHGTDEAVGEAESAIDAWGQTNGAKIKDEGAKL